MRIRAFQGLRPAETAVEKVSSPPYDVVAESEVREILKNNPLSMLRVVRAEGDPYSDQVYVRAVENFAHIQAAGHLIRENATADNTVATLAGAGANEIVVVIV